MNTTKKSGFSKERLDRMHTIMQGHVESGEMPGLVTLVSRHGETHVDALGMKAFGSSDPMQRDTIFRIASLTKPITAVAAMILVEECKLRLDDPVDRLLPELADRKVLKSLESAVDDTVPANRAITLRDLLTFRLGIGAVMAAPGTYPIHKAIDDAGLSPGPNSPSLTPDEWMQKLGSLPLIYQPGEKWMYHTGSDVLGVLIARASGQAFEDFLAERIFGPLGMKDTAFYVPQEKWDRLPASYWNGPNGDKLQVYDDRTNSRWSNPRAFPSGGGGLVSTADDYFAFCRMMLDKGKYSQGRILSRPSVELITIDHLTAEQKAENAMFFSDNLGWGFGVAVTLQRNSLESVPGRFGWDGGTGVSAYSDPQEDLVGILLTQRLMESPEPPRVFLDFWTSVYQAIDD